MKHLAGIYELYRAGFVSFRGALRLAGVPVPYTQAEVDDLVRVARLLWAGCQ